MAEGQALEQRTDLTDVREWLWNLRLLAGHLVELLVSDRNPAALTRNELAAMYSSASVMAERASNLSEMMQARLLEMAADSGEQGVCGLIVSVEADGYDDLVLPTPPCDCEGDGCEICDVGLERSSRGVVVAMIKDWQHPLGEPHFQCSAWAYPLLCKMDGLPDLVAIRPGDVYSYSLPDGREVTWEGETDDPCSNVRRVVVGEAR